MKLGEPGTGDHALAHQIEQKVAFMGILNVARKLFFRHTAGEMEDLKRTGRAAVGRWPRLVVRKSARP